MVESDTTLHPAPHACAYIHTFDLPKMCILTKYFVHFYYICARQRACFMYILRTIVCWQLLPSVLMQPTAGNAPMPANTHIPNLSAYPKHSYALSSANHVDNLHAGFAPHYRLICNHFICYHVVVLHCPLPCNSTPHNLHRAMPKTTSIC